MTHADTLRGMAKAFMMAGSHERADTCRAGAEALDNAHAAAAEAGLLRRGIIAMRDRLLARIAAAEYITADLMTAQFTADDLTRILEGDVE